MGSNVLTAIETQILALFDERFGIDRPSRFRKVQEEFHELQMAIDHGNEEHIKDEISDLYSTVTHLASLYGLHHSELLEMALDKISKRENNPNYKRFRD